MGRRERYRALPLAIVALLALTLLVAGCSRLPFGAIRSGVIQPGITPSETDSGTEAVASEFAFEESSVRVEVPVDRAVYAGAREAEKSAIFLGGKEPPGWVAGYYRAFVEEQHQAPFYDSLVSALHQVRDSKGLDASRYVELVTSMAQSMEYRVDPGSLAPKFPIETFGDGYGDCDDKTLLAAAVLARDGYDVAVLLFAPEKHVALGIKAPGLDYKGTGYGYVEMTRPSLVGVPSEKLADGTDLASQPEVIKIGAGSAAFEAVDQIQFIQQKLDALEAERARLKPTIDAETAALKALDSSLAAEREALKSITDRGALIEASDRYNAQVREYNKRVTQLSGVVDRYNALVDASRYANEQQTARPQVFARLQATR